MSFSSQFPQMPFDRLYEIAQSKDEGVVPSALSRDQLTLPDFAALLSPGASSNLELLARKSRSITQQRFGKVIRLFAPLYLSNECINTCKYCGFSRDNPILRVTLSVEEVRKEAEALVQQGFRN